MRLTKALVAAATVVVAATALVGCTGAEEPGGSAAQIGALDEKVVDVQAEPGSVEGYAGALDDSEVTRCESADGALQVAGTVTNPEPDTQDYRVYVSAMDGGDTAGLVQVDVTGVGAGETAEWSTEMAIGGEGLECVLRVERFAPQG